jgi:hypothetical protein
MHRMIDSCLGQNECILKKISSSFISAVVVEGCEGGKLPLPMMMKIFPLHRRLFTVFRKGKEGKEKKIIKIHMANG